MHIEYTKALLDLIHDGTPVDEVLAGVQKVMAARGHDRLYGKVLRNALRVLSARNEYAGAFVSVARKSDIAAHEAAIKEALAHLGAEPEYEVGVDEALIGGYVVQAKNTLIDASYKKALVKLYHNIVH